MLKSKTSFEMFLRSSGCEKNETCETREGLSVWEIVKGFGRMFKFGFGFIVKMLISMPKPIPKHLQFDNFMREQTVATRKPSRINVVEDKQSLLQNYILVLYGTEYGASEDIAQRLRTAIRADGLPLPIIVRNMERFQSLKQEEDRFLGIKSALATFVICSTQGDGVPPTGARDFVQCLKYEAEKKRKTEPRVLEKCSFAVLALGDRNYPCYCQCGRDIDDYLERCGGNRLISVETVDQEDPSVIASWLDKMSKIGISLIEEFGTNVSADTAEMDLMESEPDSFSVEGRRKVQKFIVKKNRPLCMPSESAMSKLSESFDVTKDFVPYLLDMSDKCYESVAKEKQVYHVEFEFDGDYEPGDALGLKLPNDVDEVNRILGFSGYKGCETTSVSNRIRKSMPSELFVSSTVNEVSLFDVLRWGVDIRNIQASLNRGSNKVHLIDIAKEKLPNFLEIISLLRPLQPRLYSISSSPLDTPNKISITASLVHYCWNGDYTCGVATGYIGQHLKPGCSDVYGYIEKNDQFRLPSDFRTPLIMIGPGTGFAPFRSFMLHRRSQGALRAPNRNPYYLFYGCRSSADAIYLDEVLEWEKSGLLDKACVAFSRTGNRRTYVQDLLLHEAPSISDLIMNKGAHVYVCGDGTQMARDVHSTLERILMSCSLGSLSPGEYLLKLEKEGKYQKDVW